MIEDALRSALTSPLFLAAWLPLVGLSLAALLRDLARNNPQIGGLMKWVWVLTVLYSGPLGLWVYYYSGRAQIARDSLWRRGFRSVAHCYSGCGAGEIVGVLVTAGLLSLGTWWVAGVTFALAYVAGFGMTVGPLMQEGVGLRQALWDAFYSETASITVMEVVAIGTDIWLAGDATMAQALFWSSLVFSLSVGLLAAYPVNVVLIRFGVKSGMHSPKEAAGHGH
ncbi:MAG TPA: DUF4396 domain-containing protein [Kiloniellales bacterium]|nr:DUF4396 domain-containing protein [Kiloniellales bacterium]